jgi:hypothetical protein
MKNKVTSTEVPENIAYEPEEDTSDMGGSLDEDEQEEVSVLKVSREEKERLKAEKKVHGEQVNKEKKLEEEKAKIEEKRKKIDNIKERENEVMKALRFDDYENLVSDCYTELDVNTEMVLQKKSYGCIVEGKGGTGKTYRILNQCIKAVTEEHIAYIDSFTTPTAVYVALYENRDKDVLIFDDCADMMNNGKILAMLKGALWHVNDGKTRIVSYLTTKPPKDEYGDELPRNFEFDGRIIIITNYLKDDNPHVKAVLSRVNRVLVEVPRKELLKILCQVVKKSHGTLNVFEREECVDFLEVNTNNQTEELNIRTLLRVMDYRWWAKDNNKGDAWKILSLKLLQKDDRLVLVEKLLLDESFATKEDLIDYFIEKTGASRPTYYRLEKIVKKQKASMEKELKKKND